MKYSAASRWSSGRSTMRSSTRWTSILIDEARTPLIISGPTDDKSELYMGVDAIVKQFDESRL